uniref:Uncharacterized protein mtdC n=1 Tax=uncultured bacterium BAC10-10 TaxID=333372 RepID=Q4JIQ6_9BACT|nr:hypothetical protein [uncultured bacterium BAC10-10]
MMVLCLLCSWHVTPHIYARLVSIGLLGLALTALGPRRADAQSTPTAEPPNASSQAATAASDERVAQLAEPDFRLITLPSTLRLPLHKSNFQLTHRFNGNLRNGSFGHQAGNLFGLDQGAVVGFEYRFAVVRHVQAAVYRTAIDKTFQFYGKYDAVHQRGSAPVSISGLVSVEGGNNFRDRYAPALGVVVSRTVGDRFAMYVAPVWVHNTAAVLKVDRDTTYIGVGGRLRVSPTVYVVAETSPRVAGYSPDKPAFAFGVEKRAGGHLFQLNFGNGQGTTFGQTARGGFPHALFMGFNLARKFF